MRPKAGLDIGRVEVLQDVADRCMGRCPLPSDSETRIQSIPMTVDESADAAIGVRARHDRQNGKQQDVGQATRLGLPQKEPFRFDDRQRLVNGRKAMRLFP